MQQSAEGETSKALLIFNILTEIYGMGPGKIILLYPWNNIYSPPNVVVLWELAKESKT